MYLGLPCYGYAVNCHRVYLENNRDTSDMHDLFVLFICKICLFCLYATAKSEILSSNKHETGLVILVNVPTVAL